MGARNEGGREAVTALLDGRWPRLRVAVLALLPEPAEVDRLWPGARDRLARAFASPEDVSYLRGLDDSRLGEMVRGQLFRLRGEEREWAERERARNAQRAKLAATPFRVGDRVLRGPKPHDPRLGEVESVFLDARGDVAIRVRWPGAWKRIGGGADHSLSVLRPGLLLPATPENLAAAQEAARPTRLNSDLERTLARWSRRVPDGERKTLDEAFPAEGSRWRRDRKNCEHLARLGYLVSDDPPAPAAARRFRLADREDASEP